MKMDWQRRDSGEEGVVANKARERFETGLQNQMENGEGATWN